MSNMTWGWTGAPAPLADVLAQVGKGWHDIVTKLIDDLFALGWDGTVYQVKEKFGGLRFYIDGTDEMLARCEHAGNESLRTCETCGKPGEVRSRMGWLYTSCEGCVRRDD